MTKPSEIGPKNSRGMNRKLFEALISVKKFPASSVISRIELFKKLWDKFPDFDRERFAELGFVSLKILTVNFKGIPSLENALREHKHSWEFDEDKLWLNEMDSLKEELSKNCRAILTYEDLREINKRVQDRTLKIKRTK